MAERLLSPQEADERLSAGEPVYVQMRGQRCRVANIRERVPGAQARIVGTEQWVDHPLLYAGDGSRAHEAQPPEPNGV